MRPVFVTLAFQGVTLATKVFIWELCSTRMGTSSVKRVKTETKTDTVHVTEIESYCPDKHKTVYVTPTVYITDTCTSTITAFVTAPQKTDTTTVTMTGTVTNLDSTTETDTYTVFSTTTVTQTPTTTSPTPAGFTPISKESGYVARKRYISIEERHAEINRRGGKVKCPSGKSIRVKVGGKVPQCSPYLYPQKVECLEIITTFIVQRRKSPYCYDSTKTRTARPKTCTRHKTRKTTTTSTITRADATVTAQTSTTIATVSTTTTTVSTAVTFTDTETATAPTYTAYAACGSDNIVTTANGGQGINLFNYNTANTLAFSSSITSPRDCCALCQQTTNCIFSAFFPPPDQRRCAFVTSGSCIPNSAQGTYFQTSSKQSLAGAIALSNGPCGQVANMGSIG